MAYKRKSWREKLMDDKGYPKVEKIPARMAKKFGKGTIVIPAPIEVDELMSRVPKGKVATINDLRAALAKKHKATIGCPICTGIFANIAAHVAEEDETAGKKRVTPYWRILKLNGVLNEKYPGGIINQASRLKTEGFKIEWNKNKTKAKVLDFEKKLFTL